MQIADPSNDPDRLKRLATMARREGIEEVVIGLTYSISPVHTHEYYAERAAILADCADMDRLYLKDPGGLLTPDAVRELAPHFVKAAAAMPDRSGAERTIELHSHCTIGLAPLVYLEGVQAGFQVVHTASGALSRGTSQPEVFSTVRNLEAIGYETRLDLDAQTAVSEHFDQIARAKGLPPGAPREFDAVYYTHQLPGGMVTTTRRMLEELRRPELFDAVLEEVTRVRAEMGYPILVTPVSQFVASQAARNVIDGERWLNVSDETIRYFLGHYGDPRAPVDPEIAERVLTRPQAKKLRDLTPISLDGARERFGRRISEEELLLRADDARGAGRRDDRQPRAAGARARGASRTQPARHLAPRARRPAGDLRVLAHKPQGRRQGGVAPCLTGVGGPDGLRLDDVRGFVFDVDGTLAHRGPDGRARPQPGAVEVLERIRASGRKLVLFTNGSHVRSDTMARALREDGLPVADDEMLTPVDSAITYIRRRHPDAPALLFASEVVRERMVQAGIPEARGEEAEVVFVAHVDEADLPAMERAARAVERGAPLLTGSWARGYAGANGIIFSRGAMVTAAIAKVTAKRPRIVGKPSRAAVEEIRTRLGHPHRRDRGDRRRRRHGHRARSHGRLADRARPQRHHRRDPARQAPREPAAARGDRPRRGSARGARVKPYSGN